MSNLEISNFELDPSYDPERLEGSEEKASEVKPATCTASSPTVARVQLAVYSFDSSTNPFAWDAENQQSIEEIAAGIDKYLKSIFEMENTLVRGIQSDHHDIDREGLINRIIKNGSDSYEENGTSEVFAAEYGDNTIKTILSGFHVFKPKCEERPQHRVDIWIIFDKSAFENVEYIHPRHNTVAKDKWRLRDPSNSGLKGVLVII